jgi:hypothetical protein
MNDAGERERIRSTGEAFARAHHTFDARLPYLFSGEGWENPLETATSPKPVAVRPSA